MKQRAFSEADLLAYRSVSMSGIQSRTLDMLHGTYRAIYKVEGAHGGACSGFFWYHDDRTEIDIEIITAGDSMFNDTINFTLHPVLEDDESPIPNATFSMPLKDFEYDTESFHEYRFDCHPDQGAEYYVDGTLVHANGHHVPDQGGTLQIKLWADGSKYWSRTPSTTDVFMSIKSITAYYNTTTSDAEWADACEAAGGPSSKTVCNID